jgi:predicted ATPase
MGFEGILDCCAAVRVGAHTMGYRDSMGGDDRAIIAEDQEFGAMYYRAWCYQFSAGGVCALEA